MIGIARDGKGSRLALLGRRVGAAGAFDPAPDWKQANPTRIRRALDRALARPAGGWFVIDACRAIGKAPARYTIGGQKLVVWRSSDGLHAAPDACPHMQARLSDGKVVDGLLVCPWHGLALGPRGHGGWRPFQVHDDGVLAWVRLDVGEEPTDRPILAPRPERYLDAVVLLEARCEPRDVIANRLDPWHGVHFHPHTFARLKVLDGGDPDRLLVRVAFRVAGPFCVEVDCTFHSPEPRCIVMTIVDGEGTGSVVETHATPVAEGRTAVIEATLATSDRPGFKAALGLASAIRPAIKRLARRLWVEDGAYAERQYELRLANEGERTHIRSA